MHADGLTSRDISEALRLSHAQVITILYGDPTHARITEHR
jgi:hypothetical protein